MGKREKVRQSKRLLVVESAVIRDNEWQPVPPADLEPDEVEAWQHYVITHAQMACGTLLELFVNKMGMKPLDALDIISREAQRLKGTVAFTTGIHTASGGAQIGLAVDDTDTGATGANADDSVGG